MKTITDKQKLNAFREATESSAREHARAVWLMQEMPGPARKWVEANWMRFVPKGVAHLMKEGEEEEPTTKYVLAFYALDRLYGGPEEGGWWYDTGELVREFKTCLTKDEAYAAARRANGLLDRLQRHKRQLGSVLYAACSRHRVCVFEGEAPDCWPSQTPHYE